MKLIDAHIHLDQYSNGEIAGIVNTTNLEALIAVSSNLESCKRNLQLAKKYPNVKPAFGYHPEQRLPSEKDLNHLLSWMGDHREEMIAVGEVGLPYYLRQEGKLSTKDSAQAAELLDIFIKLAKNWDLPIVLHAVYDDAAIVCDLLEKHSFKKAHFHWFKGDSKTIERMVANGYYISITPDIAYKEKTQKLVEAYPLELMMAETDGPWPFEGPFDGKMTHPEMILVSIQMIADLRNMSFSEVATMLFTNTKLFYQTEKG